ncbi:GspH/FimT family pseudopilin [Shewanella maritima]|uniref:GspH/FimT family pseudopilin n=1 Tax=Shewanella maritima TaxID=2520507 RepID=UPI0037370A6F
MNYKSQAGFNLVELMTTIVIASALITMAYPSFKELILHTRANASISSIQQSIQLARNMAINYGLPITVCPLVNNKCTRDWSNGFSIFIDGANRNTLDDNDKIIQSISAFHQDDIVQYNRLAIRFKATGFASGTNGTLTYCPETYDSPHSRAIIVNQAGRVRFSDNKTIICSNK